jgi:hypothetical protein
MSSPIVSDLIPSAYLVGPTVFWSVTFSKGVDVEDPFAFLVGIAVICLGLLLVALFVLVVMTSV